MLQTELDRPSPKSETRPPRLDVGKTALFLDLDGTLAAIAPTPDAVGPDPHRNALLKALGPRLGGRLAVLSGRQVDDIDRILDGAVICVAGVHGLQRRTIEGTRDDEPPHKSLGDVDGMLECFARSHRGLLLERKPSALALHYRGHPPAEEACLEFAHRIGFANGLTVQEGQMVVELRTPGPDKGDALNAFMEAAPFVGAMPVMVGDDLTDEHAFRAAVALGGYGVLVGDERPTAARYRLRDPAAVLGWLEEAAR
ncbi:MAG: trehalose-phosphatase [Caulobacter sp.]|jgi:trehalose 6-phosphate phosphatase|nr:trehalose-phosphatase [Caulobacter sp.]